jgi:hypothetical protein
MSVESGENFEMNPNESLLQECDLAFSTFGVSPERSLELMSMLRESLEKDDLINSISDKLIESHDDFNTTFDQERLGRFVRGHLFESIALESLPAEEKQYKELEQFLLWSLKDPRIWYLD